MAAAPQAIKKLGKFLDYVLGRRPDEFGLLPDESGFVKIKTLLQAMHEEAEWRHLRLADLHALALLESHGPIEVKQDLIRACNRDHLQAAVTPCEWPKLLFTSVRRRAYPVILLKGLHPANTNYIVLSTDRRASERLGRRTDNDPVVITVQVSSAREAGTTFLQFGSLFLADFIPVQTFSGPPLPKEKISASKKSKNFQTPEAPGSIFPDPAIFKNPFSRQQKKGAADWKKERRRARKEKERGWK